VAVADPEAATACEGKAPAGVRVLAGAAGLAELAASEDADIVLCAVVGTAGLAPVLRALETGKTVALATKEVLVAAGPIVMETAERTGAPLLPVDSEHSAIFQCMEGRTRESVRRLIITGSGGPFASEPDIDWESVSVEQAIAHPRWNMGRKISVDSATMMNKGLELIEARWLFGIPFDRIDIVLHPESIVHSMVEFMDGSTLAQLSLTDMRYAIQYALVYPDRIDTDLPHLDMHSLGALHFAEPDADRFPCLALAESAGRTGGTMPAVLNAANEAAVARFLAGRLSFPGIWQTVESVMNGHKVVSRPTLDDIVAADEWARTAAGTAHS
jgi:1-deoxy-D-xylulose-5-phosphate reductoisomerase